MKINSFYPVIMTPDVAKSAEFYQRYFGFEIVYESDWYVSLRTRGDQQGSYELALLDAGHPTIPATYRKRAEGLILNMEVDNVDSEYERLVLDAKLTLEQDIRDEDFGQRHFILSDPSGVLIDVIAMIPPSEEERSNYLDLESV
ncbi:VOC family protein [Paenibacillus eucommiae]|uniref:Catechol 2,3-dioxygenase-like lactoylglutathione lyase family enzyme n=1 Tax=Paenibacillus eucommiae TaxID=1355755 RepID=A0ABS4IR48_9BACL|nr:VOC family protein [Paenibacillus eucommiae]MBP1989366.1 catechol 2,3-dioxygenase-like lactoylglutathione lyase family enzyme [Paenibacillus eucommiae]